MKTEQNTLIEDLILVELKIRRPRGKMKSEQGKHELEDAHKIAKNSTDVQVIHIAEEYGGSIRLAGNQIRNYWNMHTLPWVRFGWSVIPTTKYIELMDAIARMKQESWDPAVDRLIDNYDIVKADASRRLNGLWEPAKFPSREKMRSQYMIEVDRSAITDMDDVRFRGLDNAEIEQIRESMREQFDDKISTAVGSIIERLRKHVADVSERMALDPKKAKYKKLWASLRRTCDILPGLNVTKDPRIDALIATVREKIAKWEPSLLRDNPARRKAVREAANEVLKDLDSFGG